MKADAELAAFYRERAIQRAQRADRPGAGAAVRPTKSAQVASRQQIPGGVYGSPEDKDGCV